MGDTHFETLRAPNTRTVIPAHAGWWPAGVSKSCRSHLSIALRLHRNASVLPRMPKRRPGFRLAVSCRRCRRGWAATWGKDRLGAGRPANVRMKQTLPHAVPETLWGGPSSAGSPCRTKTRGLKSGHGSSSCHRAMGDPIAIQPPRTDRSSRPRSSVRGWVDSTKGGGAGDKYCWRRRMEPSLSWIFKGDLGFAKIALENPALCIKRTKPRWGVSAMLTPQGPYFRARIRPWLNDFKSFSTALNRDSRSFSPLAGVPSWA